MYTEINPMQFSEILFNASTSEKVSSCEINKRCTYAV